MILSSMLEKLGENVHSQPMAVGVLPVWPQELKWDGRLTSEHSSFDGYHCHSVLNLLICAVNWF